MYKISDFKIAEIFIRKVCDLKNCDFYDFAVTDEDVCLCNDDAISISGCDHIGQTYLRIFSEYINNMNTLYGHIIDNGDQEAIIKSTAVMIRRICFSPLVFGEGQPEEPVALKLYQKPLPYLFMRDLVCPLFSVPLQNVRMIAMKSSTLDPAKFIPEVDSIDGDGAIFVNMSIEDLPIRNAFLCIASMHAHDLNPAEVVRQLYDSGMASKISGLGRLAFPDSKDVDSFVGSLASFADLSGLVKMKKQAQVFSHQGTYDLWWYLGLIEGMLEPVRGADWSTYARLHKYLEDFWEEVEKARADRGGEHVPFETLLRIKWKDFKTPEKKTLQSLLSNNRVW